MIINDFYVYKFSKILYTILTLNEKLISKKFVFVN